MDSSNCDRVSVADDPDERSEERETTQLEFYKKAVCALGCAFFTPLLWHSWGPASLLTTCIFLSVAGVLFWIGYHPDVALADRSPKQRRLYVRAYTCFFSIGITPWALARLGVVAFMSSLATLAAATAILLWLASRMSDP